MRLEGVQIERYHLLSILDSGSMLSSGGMGEVYLGEDTHIHRQVAIKVMRTEPSSYPHKSTTHGSEHLFLREIQAIAALDHPQILPIFDYGEETIHDVAYTYIVMPLCQEGSLAQWLRQHSISHLLTWRQVAYFISQAASALNYAHKHQILHLNIKPSNFLIRSNDEHPDIPALALTDFSIIKFHASTANVSQILRGTPAYMAPEQWQGQPVPATDQYALAVLTYLLLVGCLPFQGRQEQVMYQHLEVQPQPPSKLNSALPTDIDTVLLHALAKKPEERFASISAFARALRQALQSAPAPTVQLQRPKSSNQVDASLPEAPAEKVQASNDLHATLAISAAEAANGTDRVLKLPGGRKISITLPANIPDGHIIQLKERREGRERIINLTIAIKRSDEEHSTAPHSASEEATDLPDSAQISAASHLSSSNPARRDRGILRSRKALIAALVLLLVLANIGTLYFRNFNYIHRLNLLNATIKNPYAPPGGTLALNDPLTDNSNGYFWAEGPDTQGSCAFTGGSYHASTSLSGNVHECYAENTSFSNFTYQTQITILKGDCGGIIFRANTATLKFYYFLICQSGSASLRSYSGNGPFETLWHSDQITSDGSPLPIHQGLNTPNTLAVTANNDALTLYINQQQVTQINDSSYSQGQIGVAAESTGNSTEVQFSNAQVWTF